MDCEWKRPDQGLLSCCPSGALFAGASLVYSPVTQIMSPVITLKEGVQNFGCGGGALCEPFRRQVKWCNWRFVFLFVRGCENGPGRASRLGDGGNIFHNSFFLRTNVAAWWSYPHPLQPRSNSNRVLRFVSENAAKLLNPPAVKQFSF